MYRKSLRKSPTQDSSKTVNENSLKLLEQHWLHCRHLESERAWFMAVYATITGGGLALIAGKNLNFKDTWLPLFFLIIITVFGLLHTMRWIFAFEHHRQRVNFLIEKLHDINEICGSLKVNLMTMDIPAASKMRTRFLFPSFYVAIHIFLSFIVSASLWISARSWIKNTPQIPISGNIITKYTANIANVVICIILPIVMSLLIIRLYICYYLPSIKEIEIPYEEAKQRNNDRTTL